MGLLSDSRPRGGTRADRLRRAAHRLATAAGPGAAAALLTAASCGPASPASPASPDEVRIELSVSGGIAGVSWSYAIDGATGAVVGGECVRGPGCDWERGEVLARFAAAELRTLAARFVERGFPGRERTDYGTECCDQFTYALTYRDADGARTVRGSDGTLPAEVLDLVGAVQAFVEAARKEAGDP